MMIRYFGKTVFLFLLFFLIGFSSSTDAATVSGTVKFSGTPPASKKLAMAADPYCQHTHSKPVLSEVLVLGPGQTMGNIFVRVKSGLTPKKYPAPKDPVVLDQKGCMYRPHVFGVMVGQPIKILNSDNVLHNVHAMPKINRGFNIGMPKTVKEKKKTFRKAEHMFPIKCDVHPWMQTWAAVMEHPFFDVTEKDGKFSLKDLPAGTYEIEVWHEKLGTRTQSVTVGATDAKTVNFSFAKK